MSVAAQHLRIRVVEFGRTKVDVTLRADVAERLVDLIPPTIQPALDARGIDVAAIAQQATANGFMVCELFQLDEGQKNVCVWLE